MNGVIELQNYEFEKKKLRELKPAQQTIYNALYTYVNVKKRIFEVYPSIKTIQKDTGLSSATVVKHLKILVQKGWLDITKKKAVIGNYNVYSLKVLWNNTKKSFFKTEKKVKETSSNLVDKVSNIIKKDKPVKASVKIEEIKLVEDSVKIKEVKTPEEIATEEFNRKERMDMIKRVVNPLQKLTDNFIRLADKADKADVFMDAIMPVIEKVVEEGKPVSIKYLENAFKIALNNKKYYEVNINDSSYITKQSANENDEDFIGWF